MSRRAELVAGVALGLAAVGAVVYIAIALRNSYVGDATIYLPYARNAADGNFFQFNTGEFSSGSTSPIWALVLSLPFVVGAGITGAKVVSAIFAAAAVVATLFAALRISGSWIAAGIAALFVPGAMIFYGTSLYESGLAITLSALALVVAANVLRTWGEEGRLSPRAAAPLVAVWAALPLTRPDAAALVAAQAVALLAFAPVPRRQAIVPLGAALAAAAIPAAAYFGYSIAELGAASSSSDARAYALQEFGRKLVGPFYRNADALREVTGSPWIFALLPALAGLVLMWRRVGERWLAVYGVLGIGAYIFLLTFVAPGLYDTPRYLLPVVPIVACAVAYLLANVPRGTPRLAAFAVAGLAIGISSAVEVRDRVDLLQGFGITEHEVFSRQPVARINELAGPNDVLLSYEVQLRYFLRDDVSVLSEDGIIDGKVREYQPSGDLTAFMRRYKPDWWIADENVRTRPYLKGSVLDSALLAFRADPRATTRTIDGIRFDLVERRATPLEPGFGGWQMLFRISYT